MLLLQGSLLTFALALTVWVLVALLTTQRRLAGVERAGEQAVLLVVMGARWALIAVVLLSLTATGALFWTGERPFVAGLAALAVHLGLGVLSAVALTDRTAQSHAIGPETRRMICCVIAPTSEVLFVGWLVMVPNPPLVAVWLAALVLTIGGVTGMVTLVGSIVRGVREHVRREIAIRHRSGVAPRERFEPPTTLHGAMS